MAAREVLQRRLQPVYTAIFTTRDYKGALKLLEKKDLARHELARALKALALEGRGQRDEALEEVRGLMKDGALESDTVHYASQALARIGAEEALRELYAKAMINDVDHMDAFFEACLRDGMLPEAANTAMRMSKVKGSQDYLAWCGTIMLWEAQLLAQNDATASQADKKLTFAEAMLRKALAQEKTQSEKSTAVRGLCMLIAQTLVLEGKPSDAAKFVEEEQLGGAPARDRLLVLAEIEQIADDHEAALGHFLELTANEDPEDWRNWCGAIENAFALAEGSETARERVLASAKELERSAEGHARRGPLLARLHVNLRAYLGGERDNTCGEVLVGAIVEYLETFDGKACCFGDLRNALLPFVDKVGGDQDAASSSSVVPPPAAMVFMNATRGTGLAQTIKATSLARRWDDETFSGICASLRPKLVTFLQERLASTREDLLKHVAAPDQVEESAKAKLKAAVRTCLTSYQCLRFLGAMEAYNEETALNLVKELLNLYEKTKFLDDGAQGGQREVKVGDELVILAAHTLIDLSNRCEDDASRSQDDADRHLLTAATLLESAFEHSPNGFQLTLVLLEVYLRLGIVPRACEAYNTLSIKYIQNDSLSHLLLGALLRFGFTSEALEICRQIQDLWTGSRRENPAFTVNALAEKNFPEVAKILEVDRRLRFSHQRAVAASERFLINLENEFLDLPWEEAISFIRHQTVTSTAASGPDRFSFLIARLADIEKRGVEDLALNYDFTTKVSWDCPAGFTACRDRASPCTRGPGWSQSRACTASTTYRESWGQRSRHWLELRALYAKVLGAVVRIPNEDAASDAKESSAPALTETVQQDGKALLATLGLEECVSYKTALAGLEFAALILDGTDGASAVEAACKALNEQSELVSKQSASDLVWDEANGVLMMTVLLRALAGAYPPLSKKDKKKKKKQQQQQQQQQGENGASVASLSDRRRDALKRLIGAQESLLRAHGDRAESLRTAADSEDFSFTSSSSSVELHEETMHKVSASRKDARKQVCTNIIDTVKKQLAALANAKV
ncbi:N-alpha-acetyltransferase 25, NatB auxiliary subunit [Hondaea fermentalgiana]|uniref:N-alpha-acetyltransferase 25, NatB auxiliary subunit n=1 Tax=Hondaea fermentalgiana TaxID=2315210 RepID=A0A2R5GU78_9STRA|nr:N-alpha-acetyltransferase 25, NatB auxiliary subunit [Hondaea fermentalgiana]|eukprot:GBG33879.1 N-alpha-acetyltransferase 25, NatB auxiliary subunit [Hondaea fermentalgiana]